MPEIPEIRVHAERLEALAAGEVLKRFEPLWFTALKTASPSPSDAIGWSLEGVGQRAKYLLLRFAPPQNRTGARSASYNRTGHSGDTTGRVTFVVHLMLGGRLRVLEAGAKRPRRPRDGLARIEFESGLGLMLTEPGTHKRAGVWVLFGDPAATEPLVGLGPEATDVDVAAMAELMAAHPARLHNFLRDQRVISGLGRRLANEICHRARLSPFASTGRMDTEGVEAVVTAIGAVVDESLAAERELPQMSRSAERPSAVHARAGQPCPVCADVVRAVEYRDYTVNYCAGCQTSGRILADNTTSRFLR